MSLRSWQIIAASAVAAAIVVALLVLPGVPLTRTDITALVVVRWPAIAIAWLSVYGTAALALTAVATCVEVGKTRKRIASAASESDEPLVSDVARPPGNLLQPVVAPLRNGRRWVLRYFVRLAVVQYYTSILALLGLALSRIPVEAPHVRFLPTPIADSAALDACGAVVVVGVLGTLAVIAAIWRLVRTVSRPIVESRELRLLRQIVELLRASTPPSAILAADDAARLNNTLIEQGQRSILEAIKDLATSTNRLSRGLQEIKATLAGSSSDRALETGTPSFRTIENASSELEAVIAALNTAVAKFGEWVSSLSANEVPLALRGNVSILPDPLLQLSAELQALLREMGGTPDGGQGEDAAR